MWNQASRGIERVGRRQADRLDTLNCREVRRALIRGNCCRYERIRVVGEILRRYRGTGAHSFDLQPRRDHIRIEVERRI